MTPFWRTSFHQKQLDVHLYEGYEILAECMLRHQDAILLPHSVQADDLPALLKAVRYDNPEVMINPSFHYCCHASAVEVFPRYLLSVKQQRNVLESMERLTEQVVRDHHMDEGTALEKAWNIFQWLYRNVQYDDACRPLSHTAAGALMNRQAVCQGIAMAFIYLAERAGLSVSMSLGSTKRDDQQSNHAWNTVDLGGGFLGHVDVVAAMSGPEVNRGRAFFLLGTDTLSQEYTIHAAPPCIDHLNNGICTVQTPQDLIWIIHSMHSGDHVRIRPAFDQALLEDTLRRQSNFIYQQIQNSYLIYCL